MGKRAKEEEMKRRLNLKAVGIGIKERRRCSRKKSNTESEGVKRGRKVGRG